MTNENEFDPRENAPANPTDTEQQEMESAEETSQDPVAELTNKVAEAEKQHLLAVAELENYRRRSRQVSQEQLRYACLPLMNELLESVDNLHRAISAAENDPNSSGLLEGVKMVSGQISGILSNHGCKKIEALGQPFDPNTHQAVQMQSSNEYPADTVMLELRSGFQLHDRVIRPSQVFVSTGPEE